jgi:uncharacterized protein
MNRSFSKFWYLLLLPVLCGGLLACQGQPSSVSSAQIQTLSVSGRGRVEIPRTLARVSLGVEVQDKSSEAVQQQIADRATEVVKLLKANPEITKLETASVNLLPSYRMKDGKQEIDGYRGQTTVRFQIPPEKIGTLLEKAIAAGATKIEGVTLIASDEAIANAQKQAIAAASQDARSQATASLESLGLKQQNIVNIQINGATPPVPLFDNRDNTTMLQSMPANAKIPVIAGEQQVEATVTLQIRYQ